MMLWDVLIAVLIGAGIMMLGIGLGVMFGRRRQ